MNKYIPPKVMRVIVDNKIKTYFESKGRKIKKFYKNCGYQIIFTDKIEYYEGSMDIVLIKDQSFIDEFNSILVD